MEVRDATGLKVAVFGATGPIGRYVTRALLERGADVRVVSRSANRLAREFGEAAVERHPADLEDAGAAREAALDRHLVVHAVGLPAEIFERHVPIARNVVAACRNAGARPFLVTSYWSYGPGDAAPMAESRSRRGDSGKAAVRERQEDVFLEADGAVARLPDFYGPEDGYSLLNEALASVVAGETATWPGDPDAPRDFLYYADAGRLLVTLALRKEAYGEPWNLPGSGGVPPRELLEQGARVAGTSARIRRIRPWMARLASLVRSDVRAFLDVMPIYEAPALLDTSKLEALVGPVDVTAYGEGIPATVDWLAGR